MICIQTNAQSPTVKPTYLPKKDGQNKIIEVTWLIDKNIQHPIFKADTKIGPVMGTVGRKEGDEIKPDYKNKDGISTAVSFTTILNFGPGKDITDDTEYFDMTLGGFNGTLGAQTDIVTIELPLNIRAIKDYFFQVSEVERLTKEIASRPPALVAAKLSEKRVTKVTDRAITFRLKCDQSIRINAVAYQTNDEAKISSSTKFTIENKALLADSPLDITFDGITEGKPYIIVIEEVSLATATSSRTLLKEVIKDFNSAQLTTLDKISAPTISFNGSPKVKRTDAVYAEFKASNVGTVYAYVEASYANGDFDKVSKEVIVPKKTGASDPDVYAVEIPVDLNKDKLYRVRARAVSSNADGPSSDLIKCDAFSGKPGKLFNIIKLDISGDNLKLTPTDVVNEKIKTVVTISINGKTISSPCNSNDTTSCDVSASALFAALQTDKVPTNTAQSVVTFEVTVSAQDDSERTQTASFAVSLNKPDTSTKEKSDNWQSVLDFGKNLISGNKGKLEVKHISGQGVGGFLGSLIRGFVAP